jgi:hypothetical protein
MAIHMITGAVELRYASSMRAFGPDKKPQFLERPPATIKSPDWLLAPRAKKFLGVGWKSEEARVLHWIAS